MRLLVAFAWVIVTCAPLVRPALAVDTDGDGLLDLMDAPGFDPNWVGPYASFGFGNSGIEDLDGLNQLTNPVAIRLLALDGNQITSLESGDFDGLTNLQWLYLNGNQISHIEDDAFGSMTNLRTMFLYGNPLTELNLTGANFQNLTMSDFKEGPYGLCVDETTVRSLVLDDAVLSLGSFTAVLQCSWASPGQINITTLAVSDVSLVGLTFSDEYPADLRQLLSIETLDNVTVDPSLYARYVDEFNAFAAIEGNTVTVVPEPSTALLLVLGIVCLRRRPK